MLGVVAIAARTTRPHFIGIGGVGMCALAEILLAEEVAVSGCDIEYSQRIYRLAELGASISIGHDPAHVADADLVVVSSAVPAENPEVAAARKRGVPVISRAKLLAEFVRLTYTVAVSGTHGKTTTTALIGHLLSQCGDSPSVIAGGWIPYLQGHGRHGQGQIAICEADEYDRSFLELNPELVVITNVEPEHLDCYGSQENLDAAFIELASRVPFWGNVLICQDDPGARRLLPALEGRVHTYGTSPDAYLRATDLLADETGTRFTVTEGGKTLGQVLVPAFGEHSVRNALAALAAGLELDHEFKELAAGLPSFEGAGRRFEILGDLGRGVTVVDDYGHHPTEISAVLDAAHQRFPGRRIVVIFQPHLFSRTRDHCEGFGRALLAADVVLVLPIYPAREEPIAGISSRLVVEAAQRLGHKNIAEGPPLDEALPVVRKLLEADDVVMTIGAGDITILAEALMEEDYR